MAKIEFDKYYTSPKTAKWCIDKTFEIIGKENITEIIEPSAGSGSFSHQLDCRAFDLYPQHEIIEKADFLSLDLNGYRKGRLFIGNPPFGGSSGKLIQQFYRKCCIEGDYIAFILPASYYNSYHKLNKFEIIYSTIIEVEYTNLKLKSSFNIYKRNIDCDNYKPEKLELTDVIMKRYGRDNKKKQCKKVEPYDYCVKIFGDPLLCESEPYKHAETITFRIPDDNLKTKVISYIQYLYNENIRSGLLSNKSISLQNISKSDLIKLLKIGIPELK